MVLLKLYREFEDGAFGHWAGCGVPDLPAIVRSGDPGWQLRALRSRALELLAAQQAATQVGRRLGLVLSQRRQRMRMCAVHSGPARSVFSLARAQAAIEAGELEEGEVVDLRRAAWRYRALGLAFPGEALEALGEELKTLLGYCGRLDSQGACLGRGRLRAASSSHCRSGAGHACMPSAANSALPVASVKPSGRRAQASAATASRA